MIRLESERLILRTFKKSDAKAMFQNWIGDPEVMRYLSDDALESLQATEVFVEQWLSWFHKLPAGSAWHLFSIELKSTGEVIGTIDYHEDNQKTRAAETGYNIGKKWWGKGYATEALRTMIDYCFKETGLTRIWANHDSRNVSSGKVLAKAGMQHEATFRKAKSIKGEITDDIHYAILKEDWEIANEIEYYNRLPFHFEDFISVPTLSNGEIFLVCTEKTPAIPEKNWVPSYTFAICKDGEKVGRINLRLGYNESLYYSGQVGYETDEVYRGKGYAGQACRLLLPVAKAHKMKKLLLTTNITNTASKKVCEKIGARLVREARLPKWHDLYAGGQRYINLFEFSVD